MPSPYHQRPELPDRSRPDGLDGENGGAGPGQAAGDRSPQRGGLTADGRPEHGHDLRNKKEMRVSGAVAPATDDADAADGAIFAGRIPHARAEPPIVGSTATSSSPASSSHARAGRLAHHLPASSSMHPLPLPMRRVPRLSPNSRNERPAPSTLASDYFSVAPSTRNHRRPGSLPPSNRRGRATSLSPASTPLGEQAGPSRPARHLDGGDHWLSEDESSEIKFDFDRLRRARRQRPGSKDGADRHLGVERKVPIASGLAMDDATIPDVQLSPPKSDQLEPVSPLPLETAGPSIATILPKLASLLTCPSCRGLLQDPTTIACGHSHCLVCPSPPRDPLVTPPLETATRVSDFTFATPGLDPTAHLPTSSPRSSALSTPAHAMQLNNNQLYRTLSAASTASTLSVSSRRNSLEVPPIVCPVSTCEFPLAQLVIPHPPLRVDYTLRKLVELLQGAIGPAAADELVQAQQLAAKERRAGDDGNLTPLLSDVRLESGPHPEPAVAVDQPHPGHVHRQGSGSSGGGEDEPMAEDETKRAHKGASAWRSSKKRRESPGASDETSIGPPTADGMALPFVSPSFLAQLQSECECQICFQLYHEPVTAPCGHSYCRQCLARSYDHSDKCPLCRADLPPLAYFRWQRASSTLCDVIEAALPQLAAERAAAVREDELALLAHVPIFVCTTAWPGIKSYLHIFEPRYRLMIRRALETPDKSFGMVLPLASGGPDAVNEYGTMLRITNCQMLEDGRLILETIGTHRFRLIERGVVDGYNVGKIERVDDVSPEQEAALERAALASNDIGGEWRDPNPALGAGPPMTGNVELSTQQLMQICLDFVRTLRAGSAPWVIERLNRTVGEIPTNAHDFSWFAAEVFPVEDHVKVALLQITSVRERLRLIVFWIEQIRSSWWYSRGCTIS
ncbi:hypothetical protein JCM3770_000940 [Rhodotorula araucariae]